MTESVIWSPISGGITAPSGFKAAGLSAGLKPSGKSDLSLLLAPEDAVCAGTFTTSVVRAACVDLCADRLQVTSGRVRAVVTNSGQANACTGDRGLADSLLITEAAVAEGWRFESAMAHVDQKGTGYAVGRCDAPPRAR